MRPLVRFCSMLAVVVMAALAVTPASAFDGRRAGYHSSPPVSVFPQPRDPWRSWGVRTELPHRVGHPRERVVVAPPPRQVWVPEQWVWDGATWVWWPGHWVR